MNLKRTILMVLSLVALSIIMIGCSKNPTSNSSNSSKNEGNKAVEVRVGYPAGDVAAGKFMEELIDEFNNDHEDIKIKGEPISGDYNDSIKTQMASNTEPDIISLDPQLFPSMVDANKLLPLDDFMGDYDLDDFEENLLQATTYQDQLYGLPIDYNTLALFYNETMLEEAGVQVPKTWEELVEAATKLTSDNVKGLVLQNELPRFQPLFYSNGGSMMDGDKPKVNSKENVEALEYWISLFKKGIASTPADLGVGWDGDAFAQGLAAMTIEGNWMSGYIEELDPNLKYGIAQIPMSKEYASMAFTGSFSVSNSTKNKEAATEFLKFIASERGILAKVEQGNGGVIPARKSLKDGFLEKYPVKQAFIDAVQESSAFSYGMISPVVIKAMNDAAESLLLDDKADTQTVLDEVQKELDAELEKIGQ
ncbi:ABC transporter substrate-binding protein [Lederbergia citri]|uniref:ABC transporter substrate-binding protein n=1 Tax=Lederbergia citri TaxID=2833580 RepID=A0A942T9M5_9BACI|nr:ABC transporter substrate-binding protein [Lederbergia citri]MBS4193748.1 ABC transporter substrate-binding protein [Lederbergia citri]